ncbi:MAG: FIST signal transduction protein [bacterium]
MHVEQLYWNVRDGWHVTQKNGGLNEPQLVIYFSSSNAIALAEHHEYLSQRYPSAHVIGCTTAGEIIEDEVYDDSVVATALEFKKTRVSVASVVLHSIANSFQAGAHLGSELNHPQLRGALILSDGTLVNGSELVRGFVSVLGNSIPITGGLAGDGARFETTLVSCNGRPESGRIAAIGLYGDAIQVGYGSVGGWEPFGPEIRITKSSGSVLYELDGKPALDLYKRSLGPEKDDLPGNALLFPLMIRPVVNAQVGLVRTVLSIDEKERSMTFAGDIPEGYYTQIMQASFERLVESAGKAARFANMKNGYGEKLALIISCVGRKVLLGQRTANEVKAVREILGKDTYQLGFYSYGEISPHGALGTCELHNQTVTVTTLSEN